MIMNDVEDILMLITMKTIVEKKQFLRSYGAKFMA